ncbi:apocarotenoid-15,15'-oxygenase-like [Biomphalaria glabrata]|uniref:Apocarotenoid-15,15'-oxygenase-like n=1 Tax=Biomphalaria glabrata TaxID=6526 RepID=A0A9W3AH53_BIOGL|nr:apocarotenoid-15,15'-oxygenase-like [Biomphalaria glabrata]
MYYFQVRLLFISLLFLEGHDNVFCEDKNAILPSRQRETGMMSQRKIKLNIADSDIDGNLNQTSDDGFNLLFQSNPEELLDVPVTFEKSLPSWLKGSLVRNGLGMFEIGPRTFLHAFDGFAKLASWKFSGNPTVLFSTKFIKSDFYRASKKAKTIAPYLSNQSVSPGFNLIEKLLCLIRGVDNMNVNIYEFRNSNNGKTEYAAMTDVWSVYKIGLENLTTEYKASPKLTSNKNNAWVLGKAFLDLLSSAHPLPEPGTQNYLTFLTSVAVLPWVKSKISLVRINSLKKRSVVSEWGVDRVPYMHSFSVTETKAILLANPFFVNIMCIMRKAEPFSCLDWHPKENGTLYVINLKSGKVMTITLHSFFSMHHVNAYDINDQEIIMDISTYPSPDIINAFQLSVMRDPFARNSFDAQAHLRRFHIDLKTLQVHELQLLPFPVLSLASRLDFPIINENFRSKKYCYVYGLVLKSDNVSFGNMAIVKKDMCYSGTGDRTWQQPGHYPVEPWFVPRPGGTSEDDGLLLVPVLDGQKRQSYLAILDAVSLRLINRAYTPTHIPYSLHGRFLTN